MRAIGVVLDLTLRHTKDDIRVVDIVKKCLIDFVRKFEGDDIFYLYNEMEIDFKYRHGERTHAVASYVTDGFEFDLYSAMKQTLYLLQAEDPDFDKVMYVINDRVRNASIFDKIVALNNKDGGEIKFVLITSQLLSIDGMEVMNFKDPIEMDQFLKQENYGNDTLFNAKWTPNASCQTDF